ncbi:MAG: hypothetical protein U1E51_06615 [Candidatus Binatia bacterium]|nr:hypothetical protein [Candidatus Binatia bacterium]
MPKVKTEQHRMNIWDARSHLAKPLVFGDRDQIEATKVLADMAHIRTIGEACSHSGALCQCSQCNGEGVIECPDCDGAGAVGGDCECFADVDKDLLRDVREALKEDDWAAWI